MSEKDKPPSENPPIMLSDLDSNMLESFGDGQEGGALVNFT